jgi:hypothetical protein
MMPMLLLWALQRADLTPHPPPTGLEWMVIASILVPAILLAVIVFAGRRRL